MVGGVGGLAGGLAAIFSFLARSWAKQAAQQTRSDSWVNGKLKTHSVADYAKHSAMVGEAARQEITDLGEWVKGNGRRRMPTSEIPDIRHIIRPDQESLYE